ncbi:MAG: DnaJ domain-containing protein [Candidatus Lokiarchaeota archaeon]|nr:DnaJ domain-containing protein [Candidatus Lokiarchaeota archaeon]MBD3338222.1 DnaJ domain-containing protein [Candidatus Lokiarchaeota archaeon]
MRDYYKILNIEETANKEEIKRAFRRLARKYHPDVNPREPKSGEKFKIINQAYLILVDDNRRKMYDNLRRVEKNPSAYQNNVSIPRSKRKWTYQINIPRSDRSKTAPGNDIKFKRTKRVERSGAVKSALFGNMKTVFDVSSKSKYTSKVNTENYGIGPVDGDDLRYDMEISFLESYYGGQRKFQYKDPISGESKNLLITFLRGTEEGEILRLEGKGLPGMNGGEPGDLYVVIHLKDHPIFERKGDDLYVVQEVPFSTAVLGGEIQVPAIKKSFYIYVPPRTKDGTVLRLKGQGFYNSKRKNQGHLLIEIKIKVPREISEAQKKELEILKKLGL